MLAVRVCVLLATLSLVNANILADALTSLQGISNRSLNVSLQTTRPSSRWNETWAVPLGVRWRKLPAPPAGQATASITPDDQSLDQPLAIRELLERICSLLAESRKGSAAATTEEEPAGGPPAGSSLATLAFHVGSASTEAYGESTQATETANDQLPPEVHNTNQSQAAVSTLSSVEVEIATQNITEGPVSPDGGQSTDSGSKPDEEAVESIFRENRTGNETNSISSPPDARESTPTVIGDRNRLEGEPTANDRVTTVQSASEQDLHGDFLVETAEQSPTASSVEDAGEPETTTVRDAPGHLRVVAFYWPKRVSQSQEHQHVKRNTTVPASDTVGSSVNTESGESEMMVADNVREEDLASLPENAIILRLKLPETVGNQTPIMLVLESSPSKHDNMQSSAVAT